MVPAAFVLLEALPLTPNGKVDRQHLPAPAWARPPLAAPYVAPRTPVETQVVSIWAEVLGLDRVGINDPFLELGGDSLLAARVMTRVLDTLQVDLPQSAVVQAATVAQLAAWIVQQQAAQLDQDELQGLLAEIKEQGALAQGEPR
jgi:acyl carrier protein